MSTHSDVLIVDAKAALKLHDELLAVMPEGARHDSDICPMCVEKASATSDPSGSGRPDVSKSENPSTEGGTIPPMSDISQEAHEALLKKAVEEALKTSDAALATKSDEAKAATDKAKELEDEVASVKADNDRLNKELDAAQVKLKSAEEEVASLKEAATKAEEEAKLAEVASKRSDQVKNLKLFSDEYVSEKASKWATLEDADWAEQLEEWKQLKPAAPADEKAGDQASAMTGTSEKLTKEEQEQQDAAAANDKPKPARAVLGLR